MDDEDEFRMATEQEIYEYLNEFRAFPGSMETEHGLLIPVEKISDTQEDDNANR